jgi:hypothetical protein
MNEIDIILNTITILLDDKFKLSKLETFFHLNCDLYLFLTILKQQQTMYMWLQTFFQFYFK